MKTFLAVILGLLAFTPTTVLAAPDSPSTSAGAVAQSEYEGKWTFGTYSDNIQFTIKSRVAEDITGTLHINGRASYHNRDLPFTGKFLDGGKHLVLNSQPYITVELEEVSPGVYKGTGRADRTAAIEVRRVR